MMAITPYVEKDCTFHHEGRAFTMGGAVVTDARVHAYLGKDGTLTDWHGKKIGTYRITGTWKTPRSFVSSRMHQVEARVVGVLYVGRSAGEGMSFSGKRKVGK